MSALVNVVEGILVVVGAIVAFFLVMFAGTLAMIPFGLGGRDLVRSRGVPLAKLAARRRADGSSGLVARLALHAMVHSARPGGPDWLGARKALDLIGGPERNEVGWQRWLAHPTDDGWASLVRWPARQDAAPSAEPLARWPMPPPGGAAAQALQRVFAEAVSPHRDAEGRARIGEFCARHELAPQDPADRAAFLLLTGQVQQYQAADPDGSLLAVAYQEAGEATRAALRQALAAAGDVDALRALAQRPRLAAEMTSTEAAYLARGLAGRGDLAGLWRLARDSTLEQALAVVPLLGGWQPPSEAEQLLLELLRSASPGLVGAARQALRVVSPAGFGVLPTVTSVSFAPDLSQVAVASVTGDDSALRYQGERLEAALDVLALPGGQRVFRRVYRRRLVQSVLHLGDKVLAAETARYAPGQARPPRHALVSYSGGERKFLGGWRLRGGQWWNTEQQVAKLWQLARVGSGYAAAEPSRGVLLVLGTARSKRERTRMPLGKVLPAGERYGGLSSDPGNGLIAITAVTELAVLDVGQLNSARVVARDRPGGEHPYRDTAPVFCGPGRLVTVSPDRLRLCRLDGSTLTEAASRPLRNDGHRPQLAALPAAGLLACRRGDGQVSWFDAETLAPAAAPPGVLTGPVTGVWASSGGEYLAVAVPGRVRVCGPWPGRTAGMLTMPMASMGLADLAAASELERSAAAVEVRTAMSLLRACLQHRLGADIALGEVGDSGTAAGPADIGLSPAGETAPGHSGSSG